jgi:phosphoglycolate phosphatase-like HAD superfamily hydrolase
LLRAGPGPERAFERAFEEIYGIKSCWGDTQPHGRTDPDIVREISLRTLGRAILEAEYQALTAAYVSYLEPILAECPEYHILPGVREICQALAAREHIALGIETGNVEEAGYIKLRRGKLAEYFTFGGFGSDEPERRNIVRRAVERAQAMYQLSEVDPARDVIVIGDAPQDIDAGRAFGARTVAVGTGRYSAAELEQHQPDFAFDDLSDLAAFLDAVGEGKA